MSDWATVPRALSIADYETFVAARSEEEAWELVDGAIEMMTNPTENHNQIGMNLAMPLKAALDGAGCRTYVGGMRVQAADDRGSGMAVIPDIVVRCGPSGNKTFITDPILAVEVLSRSTMDRDRGPKLAFYKSLPTLRHVLLVYQDQMRVEHYRRGETGWTIHILTRPDDVLALDALGVSTTLATIYFDVRVLRPIELLDAPADEPPTPIV